MKKTWYYQIKSIIIGLLGLSLIVIVHELGHFGACKLFGIGTPLFSIGFDPKLISTKIGSTEFQIGALPLGGYVSINPQELAAAAYWKKMIIIFAGIFNNIIFAVFVFFFIIRRSTKKPIPVISEIKSDSPAHKAGLQVDDTIIAIDNENIHDNIVKFFEKITSSSQKTIVMTIKRGNQQLEIPILLTSEHPLYGEEIGYLGAKLKTIPITRPSIKDIFHNTGSYIKKLFQDMSSIVSTIFKNKSKGILGPIGIITGIGKSAEFGLDVFLFFLAIISLNVAFFNILPIPFFDGGKALHFTIEALAGGSLPSQIASFVYFIILLLFLCIFILLTKSNFSTLHKK